MNVQRVVFTALPQGIESTAHGKKLRLLALISPRLYTDEGLPVPQLKQFPDFVDWPSRHISWKVILGSNEAVTAAVTSPAPDSAAWKAVFSKTSYVQPYEFQSFSGRVTRSYPHAAARKFVFDLYGKIASASPVAFPARSALFAPPSDPPTALNPVAFGRTGSVAEGNLGSDSEVAAIGALEEFLNTNLAAQTADLVEIANASGVTGPEGIAMLQVKSFLQARTPGPASGKYSDLKPVPPPAPPGTVTPPGEPQPIILDFHQVIAGMGDHAALLSALGLVVEARGAGAHGSASLHLAARPELEAATQFGRHVQRDAGHDARAERLAGSALSQGPGEGGPGAARSEQRLHVGRARHRGCCRQAPRPGEDAVEPRDERDCDARDITCLLDPVTAPGRHRRGAAGPCMVARRTRRPDSFPTPTR